MHAWFIRSGCYLIPHRLPGSFLNFTCLIALPFNNPLLLHCFFWFFLITPLSLESDCPESTQPLCKLSSWLIISCPLLSSAFLSQGTCCSGSSCSCPSGYTLTASFHLSLGAFIHLHGFSNYRMSNNVLLCTLPRITWALDPPLPRLFATSLGSAIFISPFSRLLSNICSCVSDIITLLYSHC